MSAVHSIPTLYFYYALGELWMHDRLFFPYSVADIEYRRVHSD